MVFWPKPNGKGGFERLSVIWGSTGSTVIPERSASAPELSLCHSCDSHLCFCLLFLTSSPLSRNIIVAPIILTCPELPRLPAVCYMLWSLSENQKPYLHALTHSLSGKLLFSSSWLWEPRHLSGCFAEIDFHDDRKEEKSDKEPQNAEIKGALSHDPITDGFLDQVL